MPSHPANVFHDPVVVAQFLENVRGAVPLAIEQIDTILRLISAARPRVESFLNICCADGCMLAAAMLEEFPHACGVLLDTSNTAMETARQRLKPHASRVQFRRADWARPGWMVANAETAPFDAIICGFGTHALPDARKRSFYSEIFRFLKRGGIFLNLEHVASATRWSESMIDDYLIGAIFREQLKDAAGKTGAEVAREYYRASPSEAVRLAPLEVQCDWLHEIGFENVDCYLKISELAVFGGQRPE